MYKKIFHAQNFPAAAFVIQKQLLFPPRGKAGTSPAGWQAAENGAGHAGTARITLKITCMNSNWAENLHLSSCSIRGVELLAENCSCYHRPHFRTPLAY